LEEKQLHDYTLVLLSARHQRQRRDLQLVEQLAACDLYDTTILLEEHQTGRVFHYFEQPGRAFGSRAFHDLLCVQSSHFSAVNERAIKSVVVVPECHTFSTPQLNSLLKWLCYWRDRIRRVVMLGTLELLPLHAGHAWLDLLRHMHRDRINPLLWDADTQASNFTRLVNKQWSAWRYSRTNLVALEKGLSHFYNQPGRTQSLLLSNMTSVQTLCLVLEQYFVARPSQQLTLYMLHGWTVAQRPLYKRLVEEMDRKLVRRQGLKFEEALCEQCYQPMEKPALFLVDQKYLLQMDKSELNYLFAGSLDLLLLTDLDETKDAEIKPATATEPLRQLAILFTASKRYLLRYTVGSM
jgi:hypothetical protein